MTILIKQANIVDSSSPFNGQTADIFIENSVILKIDKKITDNADQVIDIPGLHASPVTLEADQLDLDLGVPAAAMV